MYSVYSKSFSTWALSDSSDLATALSGDKLFQFLTVLTKNDHFLKSLVADGIAYEWFWTCLDFLVGLVKWFSLFIATMLFIILYIIISLASFLLVCRLFHFRSSNIVLTLDLFLWLPVTYRAVPLCTFSILSIWFLWYGSQTVVAYSSCGLTRDL